MATEKEYGFKKTVKKLSKYKGSGTQLISVYVPAGYPIHEVTGKLREELSQSSNIKSKQTKTNVQDALEKIINYLKMFRKTPENGLAVFCGNISDDPSKSDVQLFSLEPLERLSASIYRCDSEFFLEPLERMMESKDSYGIVVMDGREATLAMLKGTQMDIIKTIISHAHAKIKVGGQSAMRFQRLIEESREMYYKKIGEAIDSIFLGKVKGIIIGGPGPSKDFFIKAKTFNYQLNILGVVNTGYSDSYGVREVMAKSGNLIQHQEAIKEREFVERFIKKVVKEGLATYGLNEVIQAVEKKQASMILVSEDLELTVTGFKCPKCEFFKENIGKKIDGMNCPKCNASMIEEEEMPVVDYIIDLAMDKGIEVEVISTKTVEGAQFLNAFGGLGAFLRYK
ncbi:peptide chain release factor aRF-1 [Candidatus Micrarchaeota archaeon]|nr:peptide chain release factor aRF-1 [Candidatus Micrarchaeota archaeon]